MKTLTSSTLSLRDLLGGEYIDAVIAARAVSSGEDRAALEAAAAERVDLYPEAFRRRGDELLRLVGRQVAPPLRRSAAGASTASFNKATRVNKAPLAGYGFIRIGEDGRAYLVSKSEHYHASVGHSFPGYRLVDNARRLGIANVTHNNTRGHITRLLEEELVRTAGGLPRGDRGALERRIASQAPRVLNRVINLETGSLAVEAALKMMLARFYRLDGTAPAPEHEGRTPVFLVIADNEEGLTANYHGTTILTQMMRGMWPQLYRGLAEKGLFAIRGVRINDPEHFQAVFRESNRGDLRVAGFFHELILMNYGGIHLEEGFLRRAHELCNQEGVPTCVDEIQSCIWSPELFLFREYGLEPDFVSVGKGFPGGQYAASRILATAAMDNLNQFGALVTNGQEELASLSYLVTMEFAQANAEHTREVGDYYAAELAGLASRHGDSVERIEGLRHLSAIFFRSEEKVARFIEILNDACIDISAHTYKAKCPPSALTKLPLTATSAMVDFLVAKMHDALKSL